MKKRSILVLTLCVAFLAGCTQKSTVVPENNSQQVQQTSEVEVGVANPWVDSSLEEIESNLGIKVSVPKDATQTGYRALPEEGLYEINFVYQDMGYDYRLKKTDALEDISGLFYDWTVVEDEPVGDYTATDYRAKNGEETVDHIIWYDEAEGVTHSLSTSARDLDGFYIAAIAEKLIGIGSDDDVEMDYHAFYAPVIDDILDMINNGYDFEKDYTYPSTGITERVMYGEKEDLLKEIGFAIEDISGDGIPELIIGEDSALDMTPDQNTIYDVYTCSDGQIVCALEGWARNSYSYLGNGRFYNMGSNGAMYAVFGTYHLTADGTELICEDCYFTYDKNNGSEIGYYHNNTGVAEPEGSEELDVSDADFWNLYNDLTYESIGWTPVGEY